MSDDIETLDSTNETTEEVDKTEEVEETDVQSETEDTDSLEEKNKKLFERAKKAEAEAKALKAQLKPKTEPESTPSEKGSLSLNIRDLAAIKDLEVEDAEWLATHASKYGISIADARKDKDVKIILANRAEERRTAETMASGTQRRGTSKVSDEALLEKARKGEIPEDDDQIRRVVEARYKKKPQ